MHTHDLTYSGFFGHRVWRIALIFISLTASCFTANSTYSPTTPALLNEVGFSAIASQQNHVFTTPNNSLSLTLSSPSGDASQPHFPALFPPEFDEPDKQKIVSAEPERTFRQTFTHRTLTLLRVVNTNFRFNGVDLTLCFLASIVMLD